MSVKIFDFLSQLASPVTVRVTCYTITNNYMEKKWLTRKPWEKPISQMD